MYQKTLDTILESKLIAIVRGLPVAQMEGLAHALAEGGLKLMEVTFAQSKPETWAATVESIQMLSEKFDGKIIPGAGTVVSLDQLHMAKKAGAQYIISPNTNVEIIKETRRLELVSLPGAMTPTEMITAYEAGANMVKVFPIGNLGSGFIKAVKAPLSHIPMLAVGGVNEKNAAEFLSAGALGLGVGGNLVNKEWIEQGQFDKITELARAYVAAVQ